MSPPSRLASSSAHCSLSLETQRCCCCSNVPPAGGSSSIIYSLEEEAKPRRPPQPFPPRGQFNISPGAARLLRTDRPGWEVRRYNIHASGRVFLLRSFVAPPHFFTLFRESSIAGAKFRDVCVRWVCFFFTPGERGFPGGKGFF